MVQSSEDRNILQSSAWSKGSSGPPVVDVRDMMESSIPPHMSRLKPPSANLCKGNFQEQNTMFVLSANVMTRELRASEVLFFATKSSFDVFQLKKKILLVADVTLKTPLTVKKLILIAAAFRWFGILALCA